VTSLRFHIDAPHVNMSSAAVSDTVCRKVSALLDGTFFRVLSVADGGTVKAVCVSCPAGKKPLSGSLGATTNFLMHLKVSVACAVLCLGADYP
jgi:hypothetical protein